MNDFILEVSNLAKHFPISHGRKVQALNDISFNIRAGETLALVGESGSGKTTAGRCVLGLERPTSGEIRYKGRDISGFGSGRAADLRGRIQLVFQEPMECLNPRRKVHAIIGEPLAALGLSRADREAKILTAARFVGIDGRHLDLFPADLSAGFQQRVGIARAIATEPDLIVLDEPTSTLDPTTRSEIVDLLVAYQKRLGASFLFISHDLGTVRYLADRVAVLYLGSIVEEAPKRDLFSRASHPYTQGLLSSELLPHPRMRPQESLALKGEIPSPINLPPGCALAARCPLSTDICHKQRPPLYAPAFNHTVLCHNGREAEQRAGGVDQYAQFEALLDAQSS